MRQPTEIDRLAPQAIARVEGEQAEGLDRAGRVARQQVAGGLLGGLQLRRRRAGVRGEPRPQLERRQDPHGLGATQPAHALQLRERACGEARADPTRAAGRRGRGPSVPRAPVPRRVASSSRLESAPGPSRAIRSRGLSSSGRSRRPRPDKGTAGMPPLMCVLPAAPLPTASACRSSPKHCSLTAASRAVQAAPNRARPRERATVAATRDNPRDMRHPGSAPTHPLSPLAALVVTLLGIARCSSAAQPGAPLGRRLADADRPRDARARHARPARPPRSTTRRVARRSERVGSPAGRPHSRSCSAPRSGSAASGSWRCSRS